MTYTAYQELFEKILNGDEQEAPYNDPHYLEYTRLNYTRMSRWDKTLQLDNDLVTAIKNIRVAQTWIIITEPWCGDAAHSVPFLVRLAEQNASITLDLQLRDSPPFLIEDYLTNGTKSIPKLVVRDGAGKDRFAWGPRPAEAQQLMLDMKAEKVDDQTLKTRLQGWYNADKGRSLQQELLHLVRATVR